MPTKIRKHQIGHIGPLTIWLVDGSRIREEHEFIQGANDIACSYVPKNQIWLDDHSKPEDRYHILMHELYERELMKRGWPYHKAHRHANSMEHALYPHAGGS